MRAQKKCLNTHSTKINMKSRHQIYLVVYPHTAEWDENIKRQKSDVKKRSQTAEKNHIILHSPRGNKNWKPFMHRISTLLIADRYEASNKYWRDKLWIQCSQRDISEQKNLLDRTNQYYTLAKRQEENWHHHITQQQTPTLRVMTASAKEICRHQSEAQFPIESKIVATKKSCTGKKSRQSIHTGTSKFIKTAKNAFSIPRLLLRRQRARMEISSIFHFRKYFLTSSSRPEQQQQLWKSLLDIFEKLRKFNFSRFDWLNQKIICENWNWNVGYFLWNYRKSFCALMESRSTS